MHTQPWADAAGGHEEGGRVMAPRTRSRGGPQARPPATARARRRRAVAGRPPAWTRPGEWAGDHRGRRAGPAGRGGTRALGRAAGCRGDQQGEEGRPGRARLPALGGGSHRPGAPGRSTGHPTRRALPGMGGGEGALHAPETGPGPSARRRGPQARSPGRLVGQVGPPRPRAPLPGRRRRAARVSGRTAGSDAGLPNRLPATPEQGRTGPALSGEGGPHRGARARPGVRAGSLASAPEAPCAGGGPGAGRAVGRHRGRPPPGPARAAARAAVGGAPSRTGRERAGRGAAAAERHPLRRGQAGSASGGADRSGHRGADLGPRLQAGAPATARAARAACTVQDAAPPRESRGGGQGLWRSSRLGPPAGVEHAAGP